MTKSAKGTVEEPGKNVKQKSGLNKAILNEGWSLFFKCLEYKLENKGGVFKKVSPKHTSQSVLAVVISVRITVRLKLTLNV